jgi:hypothetical protein
VLGAISRARIAEALRKDRDKQTPQEILIGGGLPKV